MQDKVAVVALLLTNVAVIVEWVVSGTQRVTEELTRERRQTYSELLCHALSVRKGGKPPEDLAAIVERAELVSSREMYWSKYVPHLEASAQPMRTSGLKRARSLSMLRGLNLFYTRTLDAGSTVPAFTGGCE